VDGTTLEALFRKLTALREEPTAPFGGHLGVAVDLASQMPAQVWYAADPATNDKAFLPQLYAWLPCNSLIVCDVGYFSFRVFDDLTNAGSWIVTRLREKTSVTVQQVLVMRPHVRDRIVHLGKYRSNPSAHPMRLIEVFVDGDWHAYLTNVLDPQQLSVVEVSELYGLRCR
jgi:hypothetical protein